MRLRYDPPPGRHEWDRRDPDYDDTEVTLVQLAVMVPIAIGVVIAAVLVVGFLFAVLAPETPR